MNYRELLKKYMDHVAEEEGITFLGPSRDHALQQRFTQPEIDELYAVQLEISEEWGE
jgi:hypothetical protein